MRKEKFSGIIISTAGFFAICLVFTYLAAQDCFAQSAASVERPGEAYFKVNNDMQYYEIACHENDKEYLAYSQAVREKIRQALKRQYASYFREGDVNLFFIIRRDGKLIKFNVDHKNSTINTRLVNIAVSSLKDASPFPKFPQMLDDIQLPFSVIISFREKEKS